MARVKQAPKSLSGGISEVAIKTPKKRRGRARGSKNKNTRKDKGKRKAEEGMKIGELRKTIAAWKKKKAPKKTPKTQIGMVRYILDNDIKWNVPPGVYKYKFPSLK